MEIIFSIAKDTKFCDSGNFGSQVVAKQRVGQKSNNLQTTLKVNLPNKVDKKWYIKLENFLKGVNLQSLKHKVIIKDNTPFLQMGYNKLKSEQGVDYTYFNINPNLQDLPKILGGGILALKKAAKDKIIGF